MTTNGQPAPGNPFLDRADPHTRLIYSYGHRNVQGLPDPAALPGLVRQLANTGDYVVCLGAGNITQWAYALPEQLASAA